MKKIKHLSLLLAAALLTVTMYAQTDNSKPSQTPKAKGITVKPPKQQPPTKLPPPTPKSTNTKPSGTTK